MEKQANNRRLLPIELTRGEEKIQEERTRSLGEQLRFSCVDLLKNKGAETKVPFLKALLNNVSNEINFANDIFDNSPDIPSNLRPIGYYTSLESELPGDDGKDHRIEITAFGKKTEMEKESTSIFVEIDGLDQTLILQSGKEGMIVSGRQIKSVNETNIQMFKKAIEAFK